MTRRAKAPSRSTKTAKGGRAAKRAAPARTTSSRAKQAPQAAARRAQGPQDVSPGFTANDLAASIDWYTRVLGFTVKERWEDNGVMMGASLVRGAVSVNLSQDDWKLGRDRKKGLGLRLFITTTDDIDGYASAIRSRGGTLDGEPKDDWGFRAFGITDPDGFKLTFMKPLS
jgi:uncharacterized glyoxalase superfamily protein PhnB